jgi:hypothetical protein
VGDGDGAVKFSGLPDADVPNLVSQMDQVVVVLFNLLPAFLGVLAPGPEAEELMERR